MKKRISTSAIYFATNSDMELPQVCEIIQEEYGTPPFMFDAEDRSEYAFTETEVMRVNVTKAEKSGIIHSWMEQAPVDANYQIIFEFDGVGEKSQEVEYLKKTLEQVFKTQVVHYHTI